MVKDIRQLSSDINRRLREISRREACKIVDETIDAMDDAIPVDTWRLIDSGFGYVDGDLVKVSDQGRSHNRLPIVQPPNPTAYSGADFHHELTIKYHTPKPSKRYGIFDYAPYVLEGKEGVTRFVRTARFYSRRAIAIKAMASNPKITRAKVQASIRAGLQRGLTRVGRSIADELGSL